MKLNISPEEVQQYVDSLQIDSETESANDIDYQNAASVLYWFNPYEIYPFSIEQEAVLVPEKSEWPDFYKYCDPIKNKIDGNWWQLRPTIRRNALARLQKKEKIVKALESNPARLRNEEQNLYEEVLSNKTIDVNTMSRAMLVTLSGIVDWVKDVLPEINETGRRISRAIPMADLLAPMHRLANDFVGRKTELKKLEEYTGIRPVSTSTIQAVTRFIIKKFVDVVENPPYLIYGPGGVGKSTLLAKFILDNAHNNEPLPFAYLDIDKTVIDLEWPESFVVEAARQLSTQNPEQRQSLTALKNELERMHQGFDSLEVSKSYYLLGFAVAAFGAIVKKFNKPVLLVIDTFEEAQFLGSDVVDGIWRLLAELQKVASNLRIVVAGRTMVKEYPVEALELKELSKDEARELIKNGLKNLDNKNNASDNIIDQIINIAGLNPMSLRLTLTIVKEQGIDILKKIETRNIFFMRLREEVIQANLYGRILSHLHNTDTEVGKLADPGLILRRINPDIILYVLAGPCKLNINTLAQAKVLFDKLADEGALMTPDPDSDALIQRADIRKLMIENLKAKTPAKTIRDLHDLAIKFYSDKGDLISRAEEIYHRLCRGDDPKLVASRWIAGVESKLRNVLEELPVDARIWLSDMLGVTPDSSLLKKAGLEKWEEITARTAQRLLGSGKADAALELMRERPERSPASPLYRLELESLRLLGLYEEALFTVDKALTSLPGSASTEFKHMLLLQATLVNEALNKIDEAIAYIKESGKLSTDPVDTTIDALRIFITHIRLLRKKGPSGDNERGVLIKKVMRMLVEGGDKMDDAQMDELIEKKTRFQLNPAVTTSIHTSPALLQELVAELGKVVSQLIPYSLDYIGIDLRNDTQKNMLAKAFKDWNDELSLFSKSGVGELVERSGISSNDMNDWLNYINKNTGRTLGSAIYNWHYEISANEAKSQSAYNFDKVLVDISRSNVDLSINKPEL